MSHQIVNNCYDSHVHWLATGRVATIWQLQHLKSPSEMGKEKIEPHYFQGEWLVGFGWDDSKWGEAEKPHRSLLDKIFPSHPVALSRIDGHAVWVNTIALKLMGILDEKENILGIPEVPGGRVILDENEKPTGVLVDQARVLLDGLIPEPNHMQVRSCLLNACREFNRAGITHIRDMSCSETQWNEVVHLAETGLLTLAVEQTFSAEDPRHFSDALNLAQQARKENLPLVRALAIKVYCDGALGSEGAFLSQDYPSGSGRGLALLSKAELQSFMRQAWEADFALAVHVIGDEAAQRTVEAAHELWEAGFQGMLHLEHAQVLRPETISLMKRDRVICFLQPCHWLSDQKWLKEKLGSLYPYAFPWRALQEAHIPFFFGSDSPIEKASILNNLLALNESAYSGIPKLLGDPFRYHSHPDPSWVPGCMTHFVEDRPHSVVFRGAHLS